VYPGDAVFVEAKDLSVAGEGDSADDGPGGGEAVVLSEFPETAAKGGAQEVAHVLHQVRSGTWESRLMLKR
jgi:hypothetical protein